MDLRKLKWGALVLSALLAGPAWAEPTVWLVRPLYPGQEALVERTELALGKLMPGEARKEAIIGVKELGAALKGKSVDLVPCLSGDERCADPIDPFVAGLGFERVVLIQGGQDETGFTYKVVAYEPKTGKTTPANATNANLEKALLGAVAKVVPAASTLEVQSTPPGATVYVDDVKVGVTPLSTQVLPGERVVRIDLKLHQPVEETLIIPIRGGAKLEKTLEKVAARIVITASPASATITIDGVEAGKDKVDRGISPGSHTIRITADKHKAFEQTISVKADEQYVLDKTLEPLPGQGAVAVVADPNKGKEKPPPPPPPPPPTDTEKSYQQKSYFHASFEYASIIGNSLVGRRWGTDGTGRTTAITSSGRTLIGASAEYGTFGKYFGLGVVGVTYLTNADRYSMNVGHTIGAAQEVIGGMTATDFIDPVRIHLVTIRAIQPQVRICVWRFQFALQLGLEFRTGNIIEQSTTPAYKDGFMVLDLMASAHLSVRFNVAEGFFFFGSGNYTQYIIGEKAASADDSATFQGPSTAGFNVGVGYGF
ncbi:MAG: PEGA domain-containing protein [Myxococcota bacterium]